MIARNLELDTIEKLLKRNPIVGIIGPRQVGKTTLAQQFAAQTSKSVIYYDLENPEDEARLADPMLVLKQHKGLVVIDEIQRHPDILTGALVVRQLHPWHENISKRQVKSPKVYLTDTGILHALLNLRTLRDVEGHPKLGASWESFVIEQVIRRLRVHSEECFFWATYSGAKLDLLVVRSRHKVGFEVKRPSSPRVTPSMQNAVANLKLNRLDVIHAGDESFPMKDKIRAVALQNILKDLAPLS